MEILRTYVVRLRNVDQESKRYNQSYFAEILARSDWQAWVIADVRFGTDHEIGEIYEKSHSAI